MKKGIKIAVAVAAVLALSALTASSAFGTKGEWDWAWTHIAKIFPAGEQTATNVFTTPAGTIKCKKVSVSGTAEGTTVETVPSGKIDSAKHLFRLGPSYSECTAFGQAATVTTTGCFYDIAPSSETAGTIQIICETGKSITVHVPAGSCTVTIGEQIPATPTLDFTVEGPEATRDVLVKSTVEGITYTVTGPGTICGTAGKANNGIYTGTFTLKGYSDEAHTKQIGLTFVETVK
jgi:hypothetical protein